MNLFKLSWKNILYKPWATLLSIILFSLGVGLISLLFLLEKQLQDNFEKNLAGVDLVVGAKGSPLQLILSSMYHIDAPTGNISLKEARPFLNPNHPLIEEAIPLSMGDNFRGFRIVGTLPKILTLYDATLASGKIWNRNFEVTIGSAVTQELDLAIGDTFKSSHGLIEDDQLEHDDINQDFEVVGILSPTGSVLDQLILTNTQTFWMVHDHQADETSEAIAESEDQQEIDEVTNGEGEHHEHDHDGEDTLLPKSLLEEDEDQEITSLLVRFKGRNFQALNMQRNINENTDLQAATPAIEINRLFSLMNTGEQALRILAFVIIFVSGLSVFISLLGSLRERRYELALIRVMGARPRALFLLIILEGILLAAIGFVVGIVLSHAGMHFLGTTLQSSYRYDFTGLIFLPREWFLLLGALVIGLLAAIIPAWQASRTDISDTLSES
ncbi:MAG: FtsX-like permease family protein [Saprospiraceae bacterium]|nr:FtsX-like permease family protein [Saprospiraceae bacterium]